MQEIKIRTQSRLFLVWNRAGVPPLPTIHVITVHELSEIYILVHLQN